MLYVVCFCVIFTPAVVCCTRSQDETSQKVGLVQKSSAAVNRSPGVSVMIGDLNVKGKKHWLFLTSISDLIDTQVLLFPLISLFPLLSVSLF